MKPATPQHFASRAEENRFLRGRLERVEATNRRLVVALHNLTNMLQSGIVKDAESLLRELGEIE